MGAHYKIRAEKTGHYFTHGKMTGETRFVWVCLHGYGQLGKYFIQRFELNLQFVIMCLQACIFDRHLKMSLI